MPDGSPLGSDLRFLTDDGAVDVGQDDAAFADDIKDTGEEHGGTDAVEGGIAVGKEFADVSFAGESEQGIHECV